MVNCLKARNVIDRLPRNSGKSSKKTRDPTFFVQAARRRASHGGQYVHVVEPTRVPWHPNGAACTFETGWTPGDRTLSRSCERFQRSPQRYEIAPF
jgi:hypothetical protein